MKKRFNRLINKKRYRWVIFPLLLFFFWLAATGWYVYAYDESFLVLSYNNNKQSFTDFNEDSILKGQKRSGMFQAQDDRLGILAVRFYSKNRVPYNAEDTIVFRIKEKNSESWYYQNKYRSGFMYELPFFPFGFPVINNSKDKTYYFEIESLNGNEKNAVSLSNREPVIASKYQYTKRELVSDKQKLLHFLTKKVISASQTSDVVFSSFIFFMPFLMYMFFLVTADTGITYSVARALRAEGYLKKDKLTLFLCLFLLIVTNDIFIFQLQNGFIYLVLMVLWIIILVLFKKGSSSCFYVGILFLVLCGLLLLLNQPKRAEVAGTWVFLFLTVGTITALFESNKKLK
jgi:hypothetical protein